MKKNPGRKERRNQYFKLRRAEGKQRHKQMLYALHLVHGKEMV